MQAAHSGEAGAARWLLLYGLPRAWDAALLAALAVFLQAVAPNKLAGFGLMVLYLIASLALEGAGLRNHLYRYGGTGAQRWRSRGDSHRPVARPSLESPRALGDTAAALPVLRAHQNAPRLALVSGLRSLRARDPR